MLPLTFSGLISKKFPRGSHAGREISLAGSWLMGNDGVGSNIGHLLSTNLVPLGLVFYFGY